MSTPLKKPITRVSNSTLGPAYGPDRSRRIVITIIPGNGHEVPDTFELKPYGCRRTRSEYITVEEVYRLALRGRVNKEYLVKARAKKAKQDEKRQAAELRRRLRG